MATLTPTLPPSCATLATAKAWGQGIGAILAAIGWTKTADTGQINWATYANSTPASQNQTYGYEVWQMNDALQASAPAYLRVAYGTGAAASTPRVDFTAGFATNGIGAIVGPQQVTVSLASGYPGDLPAQCYCAGDAGRAQLGLYLTYPGAASSANYPTVFSIERAKDAAGADVAGGLILHYASGTSGPAGAQYLPAAGGVPPASTRWGVAADNTATRVWAGQVWVGFPTPWGAGAQNVGLGVAAYGANDLTDLTVVSLPAYGAAHTYLTLGSRIGNVGGANQTIYGMLRWE